MGLFDKITKLAEKAADAVVKTSDKINETYQKEGFDGIINKTADSITSAGKKTQDYLNTLGEKNKQIMESMPEKDLEATLAKATAVVINTTQTLVKDAAKVTVGTVESVSKNLEKIVSEESVMKEPTVEVKTPTTDTGSEKSKSDIKEMFLNEGQIAELDCMPISVFVKYLGAESNVDGQADKYKLDGCNFVAKDQKWYDFNHQKGGVGALSFMNHYIRVSNGLFDNSNDEVVKEIRNSTFVILSEVLELKDYRDDLSVWIKEQNAQSKNNTSTQPKEDLLDNSEPPVVAKPKRTRKPVAQKTEVEHVVETTPVKKPARKTTKKLVVEPEETKAPAKRTSKKVVKDAVSETFTEDPKQAPKRKM